MSLNTSTKSKIDEFRNIVLIKYDIFKLYISMCDLFIVEIIQSCSQLLDDLFALRLVESLRRLLFEGVAEGDSREILHDDVEMVVGLDHVVDFYNIGMVNCLQYLYLSTNCFLASCLTYLTFLIGLDCYFLVSWSVNGHSD